MKKQLILIIAAFLFTIQLRAQVEPLLLYKVQQDDACREWVETVMSKMSLKEKVGQLFIYTIAPQNTKKNLSLLREVVQTHKVGGLLFSGGRLQNQAQLTNYAQNYSRVPLMITFDGEWGLAMRLRNTPAFPRNMALGCIQDDRLIYEYGKEVARECRELGIHVNFAPVADVNINPSNPVINTRSFSEDPHNVADKVVAYASGLESGGVLSVTKHFPGHGDTDVDSHKALPTLPFTRERLDSVELYPFKQAIRAGLGGVMVGHLQVPVLDGSQLPSSLSPKIIEGLLKEELNFKGLVFTDALAMKGVSGSENLCVQALKAGNDMVLAPRTIKSEIQSVMDALKDGILTEEMIDQKCRKVLMYKYALGANNKRRINLSGLERRISTPETESLQHKLRIAAVTILGNQKKVLPMNSTEDTLAVLSIGRLHSDSAFVKALGKSVKVIQFRLTKETSDPDRKDLLRQLGAYKRVIVSVTAHDAGTFNSFLNPLGQSTSVVYAFFAPLTLLKHIQTSLTSASAVVLGHSSERDIQIHIAEVLFGKAMADGKLSATVAGVFEMGEGGIITPDTPHYYTPEELGMDAGVLARIDSIVNNGIKAGAFPGCQVYVLKNGKPVYDKCFGTFTYGADAHQVGSGDMYDLASLSKTTGTLLAVMKLYDKGRFNLTDKISAYLPFLKNTNKENITISDLLMHQSGLPPTILFYKAAIDEKSYKGAFFKDRKDKIYSVQVGNKLYANSTFKFKQGLMSPTSSTVYSLHVADSLWLNELFRNDMKKILAEVSVKEKKYAYSCVNFILLKEIVEQICGESLDAFLEKEFYRPMGLKHTAYLPLRYFSKGQIAPTVKDDFLRKYSSPLQGYVHDESAAFWGGVSGNAGLFSSAADVAAVHQLWLNMGEYEGKRYLSEETCRLFTTTTSKISRRGLGFDKPDIKNVSKSPCAESVPASVYGHTGFTGTCAWVDPDNELVYVFLSNRVYPYSWNSKLMNMNIRPKIQQVLYDAIKTAQRE